MIEMKDIKGKIDKLVDRLKNDDALKAQFKKDPSKAVESVLGVDLPDEAVKKIIAEAKTKLAGGKDEAGNAVEKAVILADGKQLEPKDFELKEHVSAAASGTLEEAEEKVIRDAMERYGGNLTKVAQALSISRPTLYKKLNKYNI